MAKAIINKHFDSVNQITGDKFLLDINKSKGEILICNDNEHPSLWIKTTDGSIKKVGGESSSNGGSVSNAEISQIQGELGSLRTRVEEIGKPAILNEETNELVEEATGLYKEINSLSNKIEEIENTPIEIGIGDNTEDNKNYLQIEDENKLSVRSIDLDSAILQEDIVVKGLGSNRLGNYTEDMVIKSGTSVYEILKNILQRELYPTNVVGTVAKVTVKIVDKDLSLKTGDMIIEDNDIVEVGYPIEINKAYASGTTISTTDSSISGMQYGYSYENNNICESTDTAIVKKCTSTMTIDNTYNMSVTTSGFVGDINEPELEKGDDYVQITNFNIGAVSEGENNVSVLVTGATYNYNADKINPVYYCSNMGKTREESKHAGVTNITGQIYAESDISKKVIGKYKYFIGYADLDDDAVLNSDIVKGLNVKNGWVEIDTDTTIIDNLPINFNKKYLLIAGPEKYILKNVQDVQGNNIIYRMFPSNELVDVVCGEMTTSYRVYKHQIGEDTEMSFNNIKIGLTD